MAQAAERERAGCLHLKELMFQPVAPPTLKQQIATVLARTREPLLAKEVQERIVRYFDCDLATVDKVRDVLRSGSEFTQPARHRWALGRIGGAWAGTLVS